MRTPAVSTCMHNHTQILYEYKHAHVNTRCVCKSVSLHLRSVHSNTYLPIKLITRTPAWLRYTVKRNQSADKYLKKNVSYMTIVKRLVVTDMLFQSFKRCCFIWQRKPLVYILSSLLKLFNAFPYHTCIILTAT